MKTRKEIDQQRNMAMYELVEEPENEYVEYNIAKYTKVTEAFDENTNLNFYFGTEDNLWFRVDEFRPDFVEQLYNAVKDGKIKFVKASEYYQTIDFVN